ncbi:hypothetical protein E2320_022768 [Naja naja]|nr:hypothetical protein E2320_022768 [Naja naja]
MEVGEVIRKYPKTNSTARLPIKGAFFGAGRKLLRVSVMAPPSDAENLRKSPSPSQNSLPGWEAASKDPEMPEEVRKESPERQRPLRSFLLSFRTPNASLRNQTALDEGRPDVHETGRAPGRRLPPSAEALSGTSRTPPKLRGGQAATPHNMADGEEVTLDGRPLQALRVADLKAALEQRGLPKSGQKSALIKRLRGALMLENLQKHSTPHTTFQPNSQHREEAEKLALLVQYGQLIQGVNLQLQEHLRKIHELKAVKGRLQVENRELRDLCCFLDKDQLKTKCLARHWQIFGHHAAQIGEEMSQNTIIKQYLEKQQELLRQRLEREARESADLESKWTCF